MHLSRSRFAALSALLLLSTTTAAGPASAQVPEGVSPEQVQQAISQPISVAPGETVSIDLGVPVSASYSGGGWDVYSSGNTVTVTAPQRPGESISVPFTALGHTADVTLTTTQDSSGISVAPEDTSGDEESGTGSHPGADSGGQPDGPGTSEGTTDEDAGSPTTPSREAASAVNTENSEFIDIPASIEGNVLTAKLSLAQATNLYRRFSEVDEDSVKTRYVDVNHRIIEGVERDIDKGSLSMTLTYPQGQAPDNPFLIELVRGDDALLIVRLTDENTAVADSTPGADVPEEFAQPVTEEEGSDDNTWAAPLLFGAIGAAGLIALAVLLYRTFRRRQVRRPDVYMD